VFSYLLVCYDFTYLPPSALKFTSLRYFKFQLNGCNKKNRTWIMPRHRIEHKVDDGQSSGPYHAPMQETWCTGPTSLALLEREKNNKFINIVFSFITSNSWTSLVCTHYLNSAVFCLIYLFRILQTINRYSFLYYWPNLF
jgi:hypothetical protein